MLKLPTNLASLARLAAKEDIRYALSAIRVRETTEGYEIVATDGRRMAVVTGPGLCEDPVPALEEAPNGACEALLPAGQWARILKGAKRQPAFVALGPEVSTFSVGTDISTMPNQEGRFPDVERVIQESCRSLIRVRVYARQLAELLLVAAEFSADGPRDGTVILHYGGQAKPLLVTCDNAEGQHFEAAMMPVT
jgi:DNA polymerase III sliding clamp (beta) subunit (PCNA family)